MKFFKFILKSLGLIISYLAFGFYFADSITKTGWHAWLSSFIALCSFISANTFFGACIDHFEKKEDKAEVFEEKIPLPIENKEEIRPFVKILAKEIEDKKVEIDRQFGYMTSAYVVYFKNCKLLATKLCRFDHYSFILTSDTAQINLKEAEQNFLLNAIFEIEKQEKRTKEIADKVKEALLIKEIEDSANVESIQS